MMAQARFIGRQHELHAIRRELALPRPSLLLVLGRRRVGKSTLLVEATREYRTIYYQATKVTSSMNLALLRAEVARVIGASALFDSLRDWPGVLTYLEQAAERDGSELVVVLDEFPFLAEVDPALPSVIQRFWDGVRERGSPLKLVLCGSKISFMEGLLAERNPLHGRQTLRLDVGPLPYRDAARFFPNWSLEQQLYAYGIFGGIPYYLQLCDPAGPLVQNLLDIVLSVGAPLADEPNNVLQAELRDVTRYATILGAIAQGCTESGKVVGRVREIRDASGLAPYVQKLAELRLIRIVRSLDATERERDRRYFLDDPFLAFWYRFCLPNSSALAAGHAEQVYEHAIAPTLDNYMAELFEWVCRDYVRLYGQELLPAAAQVVGQIWGSDFELDLVGRLLDGSMIYGESKWWKDAVGVNVRDRLIEASRQTTYGRDAARRLHLLFSRNGFTEELRRDSARDPTLHLLTPAELLTEGGIVDESP